MKRCEIPVPPGVTWQDIITEFDLAEAMAVYAGFARGQAERRAEAAEGYPGSTPEALASARLDSERAEQFQDRAESRVHRLNEALLRYRPADGRELLAKYAFILKVYGHELLANYQFRDFISDLEAFAKVLPVARIDQAAA